MIKKGILLFLLFLVSIFTLYLAFLSITSISIGLANTERSGFWMPILCGVLILCLILFIIKLLVYIVRKMVAKDKYPYV